YFLGKGGKVAAFIIQATQAKLPQPGDPLGRFLAGISNPFWDRGLAHFQAAKPDPEKAVDAFLRALETQYANGDTLNYVGACYRALGWPRLSSVFFEQAISQSENHLHRYALTNLGLCLAELDQPMAARRCLQRAIKAFPDEKWTENARKALQRLND